MRNGAAYLRSALDSVLAQSHKEWQLLISDNQSSDETAAIAGEYARRDSRITFRSQESDIGAIQNFIHCARACPKDAPFFAWFAHDDLWHPEFLSALTGRLLREPERTHAWANVFSIDSYGQYQGVAADYSRYCASGPWPAARYILEHEVFGKAMLIYSVFRREVVMAALDVMPPDYVFNNWDNVFNLSCIARGSATVDRRHLFGKRAPRSTDAIGRFDPWSVSPDRMLGLSELQWTRYFSALEDVLRGTRHEKCLHWLVALRRRTRIYFSPRRALTFSDIKVKHS